MMNSFGHDRSTVGSIVANIKHASGGFISVDFKHVREQVNVVAHLLAKSCKNCTTRVVFHYASECNIVD